MSKTAFRLMGPTEASIVVDILSELFEASENKEYKKIASRFLEDHKDKLYWVVEYNSKVVGLAICEEWEVVPKPGKLSRKYWHLSHFYIKPEVRGNNLGGRFLAFLLKESQKRKIEKIIIWAGGEYGDFFIHSGFNKVNNILEYKFIKSE